MTLKERGGKKDLLQVPGRGPIMAKLHAKLPLPLRRRPELGTEAEHAMQTAIGIQREIIRPDVRFADGGIPLVEQADEVALELVRRGDGGLHQRFEDLRFAGREGFAEGLLRRCPEGHFRGIGHVRRAVVDDHAGAEDAVADQRSLLARGLETLVACEEEFLADRAAGDLFLEFVSFEAAGGLHPAHDTRIVARAARLLLEEVVKGDSLRDGFAVGDLGLACFAGDVVFTAHTLNVDVKMQLAHAGDDSFRGFAVDVDAEGWVLALETGHSFGEFGEVFLLFGFD